MSDIKHARVANDTPLEHIFTSHVTPGSLVLGCVSRISIHGLQVSYADGLFGEIPPDQITGENLSINEMRTYRHKYILAAVVSTGKKQILTMIPSVVNSAWKPHGKAETQPLISAMVRGYEASGILLDIGKKRFLGLVPNKMIDEGSMRPPVGSVLPVQAVSISAKTVVCSFQKEAQCKFPFLARLAEGGGSVTAMPDLVGQLCEGVVTSVVYRDRRNKIAKVSGTTVAPKQSKLVGVMMAIGHRVGWVPRSHVCHRYMKKDCKASLDDLSSVLDIRVGQTVQLRSIYVWPTVLSNEVHALYSLLPNVLGLKHFEGLQSTPSAPKELILGDYGMFKVTTVDKSRAIGELRLPEVPGHRFLAHIQRFDLSDSLVQNMENIEYLFAKGTEMECRVVKICFLSGICFVSTRATVLANDVWPHWNEDLDKRITDKVKRGRTLDDASKLRELPEDVKEAIAKARKTHQDRRTTFPNVLETAGGGTHLPASLADMDSAAAVKVALEAVPIGTIMEGRIAAFLGRFAVVNIDTFDPPLQAELPLGLFPDGIEVGENVEERYPKGSLVKIRCIGPAMHPKPSFRKLLQVSARHLAGALPQFGQFCKGDVIERGVVTGYGNSSLLISVDPLFVARVPYNSIFSGRSIMSDEARADLRQGLVIANLVVLSCDMENQRLDLSMLNAQWRGKDDLGAGLASDSASDSDSLPREDSKVSSSEDEKESESESIERESDELDSFSSISEDAPAGKKRCLPVIEEPSAKRRDVRKTKAQRRQAEQDKMGDIHHAEQNVKNLTLEGACSDEDFRRLIVTAGESAEVWIRFMAFKLDQGGDVRQVRNIFQEACQRIPLSDAAERLSLFVAGFAVEVTYGTDVDREKFFTDACSRVNQREFLVRSAAIYKESGNDVKCFEVLTAAVRKFKDNHAVIKQALKIAYNVVESKDTVVKIHKRSKRVTPREMAFRQATDLAEEILRTFRLADFMKDFYRVAAMVATHEYRLDNEVGRERFNALVAEAPKRHDLWLKYLQCCTVYNVPPHRSVRSAKSSGVRQTRAVFVRATDQPFRERKMKTIYDLWLKFEESVIEKLEMTPEGLMAVKSRAKSFLAGFNEDAARKLKGVKNTEN